MKEFQNYLFSSRIIPQGLRYAINCGISLLFKIALFELTLLIVREEIAYGTIQILVFFFSYLLHSKSSFKAKLSLKAMWEYFKVLVIFQILDYLIFVIVFAYFGISSHLSILIATLILFFLRFLMMRRAFRTSKASWI
jgi:putative flippase GtrA